MTITREVNGSITLFTLTCKELYSAHKEFVTNWMGDTCSSLLDNNYSYQANAEEIMEIAATAYQYYEDERGTEWECCEQAVENWASENIKEDE